jgi:hypothetical protein
VQSVPIAAKVVGSNPAHGGEERKIRWKLLYLQYFSYIVAVSFIGGENRRKSLTCRKSLTNFIT